MKVNVSQSNGSVRFRCTVKNTSKRLTLYPGIQVPSGAWIGKRGSTKFVTESKKALRETGLTVSEAAGLEMLIHERKRQLEQIIEDCTREAFPTPANPQEIEKRWAALLVQREYKPSPGRLDVIGACERYMNQLREGQPHRKKYSTLIEDLKEYSKYMRPSLRISDIDHAWQIDFALYLLEKRPEYSGKKTVMLSVVDKKIGCIRTALRELDDTYTLAKNYRKPLRLAKDSPQPLKQTLTVEEIEQLMKVDFIQNQLNEARDWFVIGCWTALRQKDLLSLTENDFYREGDFLWLRKTQAKTRGTVDICLHPHVNEIMERHGGLPPRMTVEASHRRLPKLLALCGLFDEMVPGSVRQYFTNDKGKGELRVEVGTYPRYACMGWHTARRTCATNLVKRGVALDVVQQFTGHSTITQLLEYVKVTPEQSRIRMENAIKAFA